MCSAYMRGGGGGLINGTCVCPGSPPYSLSEPEGEVGRHLSVWETEKSQYQNIRQKYTQALLLVRTYRKYCKYATNLLSKFWKEKVNPDPAWHQQHANMNLLCLEHL